MTDLKLISRISLIIICLHFASTTAFEYKKVKKFPRNQKVNKRIMSESSINSPSEEFNEFHPRNRRNPCCTPPPSCNSNDPYRTIDGRCNNVNNPCWGAARIPFLRMLPPNYENGLNTPRGQGRNPPLPRPRSVAAEMVATNTSPSPDFITIFVMLWGQWLDHDITFTPDADATGCCGSTNAECINIDVTGDSFYTPFSVTCLPLGRSIPTSCPPDDTREQFNSNTCFIDASQVYGSSQATLNDVRDGTTIRLKIKPTPTEVSPCPTSPPPSFNCPLNFLPENTNPAGNPQFFAGDIRVEEQPSLTSIHTMFLRMHNHLASVIRNNNPTCTDETVFQETRKIIGAVQQHITYNEFLPIVLGCDLMDEWGISFDPTTSAYNSLGYFLHYDPDLDPTAFNVFSTASFRFGHSLIRNTFNLPGGTVVNLAQSFNNHGVTLNPNSFPSQFLIAMTTDPAEEMDHILVDAVHNKLFAANPFDHGQDLYSRNIQRGRDHGLPGYQEWVNDCQGSQAVTSFSDLIGAMPFNVISKLNTLYGGRIADVDLFPAGIAEFNIADALLGPTLACINARYFANLKFGDRYWYERSNVFPDPDQLYSIWDTTLASIICRYSTATELQNQVMLPSTDPNGDNPLICCDNLIEIGVVKDIDNVWVNLCP